MRFLRGLLGVFLTCLCINAVHAADASVYPTRPIRMLVPFAAGGGVDIAARVVGEKMAVRLGQPIIVENRPGAGGNIAMDLVARADPDGYTLIMSGAGPTAMNVGLYSSLPFDPVKNFAPVGLVASTVYALVIHPDVRANSFRQLLDLARKEPGKLSFASPGIGAPPHLAAELLQYMAGVRLLHVPYKGTGPALVDLLGGQIDMYFADLIAVQQYLASGKLRALAVSSSQRSLLEPQIATIAESGLPGYEAIGWTGLLAPAGTPQPVIAKLNAELNRAIRLPDVQEKLAGKGDQFGDNTPDEFARFIKSEIDKWSKLIKVANIKAE